MKTWYPTTVASAQYAKRQMFLEFLIKTGTPEDIEFKWVDFGIAACLPKKARHRRCGTSSELYGIRYGNRRRIHRSLL
jgi:hypothetical protein